jgi:hypothetical protein
MCEYGCGFCFGVEREFHDQLGNLGYAREIFDHPGPMVDRYINIHGRGRGIDKCLKFEIRHVQIPMCVLTRLFQRRAGNSETLAADFK